MSGSLEKSSSHHKRQTIEHIRSLNNLYLDNAWLTIGVFDGVHIGHQAILQRLAAGAQEAQVPAVVLTFHPHPAVVLGKKQGLVSLTTPDERAALMAALGIDMVVTYPFDHVTAATSALDFIMLLKQRLNFSWLGVGHDFALGNSRKGDVGFLQGLGRDYSFQLEVFPPITLDGQIVSSSRIRKAISQGDIVEAARMLGRNYCLSGEVVMGNGRGRKIGIPTANLAVEKDKLIPRSGVYACRATVGNDTYAAAVNIGNRPTFSDGQSQSWVEAHLLDFSKNIYGLTVHLEFLEYLREEQRFADIEALTQQVRLDIQRTQSIVRGNNAPVP